MKHSLQICFYRELVLVEHIKVRKKQNKCNKNLLAHFNSTL